MSTFQFGRPGFSPALSFRWSGPAPIRPSVLSLRCRVQEDGGESSGEEERPESLFMKELKRRGLNPTSLLEEGNEGRSIRSTESEEDSSGRGERKRGRTKRNGVSSAELDKGVSNQRERSMSLNSEGLEGLIPRAKLLLTIGGTFFLGFWPLILITFGLFLALYIFFGPSFVHDASEVSVSPPPYIDPYALLEDERLSQVTPRLN
ncbi:hypothetical protein Cni_G00952 [Canna indica]|uniref:Tubulin alpha-6 chain n=1 Tax=Canna indica TaxID=4628 RepID=A0AAQ3JNP9_9LILI|nr:hypothetical protein Cni_G00952 [Canna indica]